MLAAFQLKMMISPTLISIAPVKYTQAELAGIQEGNSGMNTGLKPGQVNCCKPMPARQVPKKTLLTLFTLSIKVVEEQNCRIKENEPVQIAFKTLSNSKLRAELFLSGRKLPVICQTYTCSYFLGAGNFGR